MTRHLTILVACCCSLFGAEFHVSTTGGTGAGSAGDPWSLSYAMQSAQGAGKLHAGDTVTIHGGIYSGTWRCTTDGTSANPIRFQGSAGERATLEAPGTGTAVLYTDGATYTWFENLEITSIVGNRCSSGYSADTSHPGDISMINGFHLSPNDDSGGLGIKVINCVIHDVRQNTFQNWGLTGDGAFEWYGNISYYVGWWSLDDSKGHGHGTYVQQGETPGAWPKAFRDSIWFGIFGNSTDVSGTSANGQITSNVKWERNCILRSHVQNDMALYGQSPVVRSQIISSNVYAGDGVVRYTYTETKTASNTVITANWIDSTAATRIGNRQVCSISGNTTVGPTGWQWTAANLPGNTWYANRDAIPSTLQVIVHPNVYEAGRANIYVINGTSATTATVDLSAIGYGAGDQWWIQDAENFYGSAVASGTYAGSGSVSFSIDQSATPSYRGSRTGIPDVFETHTDLHYGAYVLRGAPSGTNPPPATEYYVSTTGSDTTGDGSSSSPFRTLEKAVTEHRVSGVNSIKMRSGTYYLTEVALTDADSGLTIQADAGATPILSGGTNLSTWSTSGSYQYATLPAFPAGLETMTGWEPHRIWVDGYELPQARLPNSYSSWYALVPDNDTVEHFHYTGSDFPTATVLANAEVGSLGTWFYSRMGVSSHDSGSRTVYVDPDNEYNFGYDATTDWCLWNTVEGMHAGAWYHDRVNGRLYVQTNSLAGKTVLIPAAAHIITIDGSGPSSRAENIVLAGLTFAHSANPRTNGWSYSSHDTGAIRLRNTEGVTISSCTFMATSGGAIDAKNWDRNPSLSVSGCTFSDIGSYGVLIGDTGVAGSVNNCVLDGIGTVYYQAYGINVNGGSVTVTSNVVMNGTAGGIGVSSGFGTVVADNVVSNMMTRTQDGGSLYCYAATNVTFARNRLYGRPYEAGKWARVALYADEHTGNVLYSSNLVENFYDVVHCNKGTTTTIHNNFFVGTVGDIYLYFNSVTSPAVRSNIFGYTGATTWWGASQAQVSDWSKNVFWGSSSATGIPAAATRADPLLDSQYRLCTAPVSPALSLGILPAWGTWQGTAADVDCTPSVAFGTVPVNTLATGSLVVSNVGNATLNGGFSIAEPFFCVGAGEYSLAPGATKTFALQFYSSAAGTFTQTLQLTGGGGAICALSGTATNLPASLSASPASLDFGSIHKTDTAAAQSIVITNSGGTLGSGSITAPANFTANPSTYSVGPGESQTISVTATPPGASTYSGDVTFSGFADTVAVSVTGTNYPAHLTISPPSLDFPSVTTNTTTTLNVTVTNDGEETLLAGSVEVVGDGFLLLTSDTINLAGGASATTTIQFAPVEVGRYTGVATYTCGSQTLNQTLEGHGLADPGDPPTPGGSGLRRGPRILRILP